MGGKKGEEDDSDASPFPSSLRKPEKKKCENEEHSQWDV